MLQYIQLSRAWYAEANLRNRRDRLVDQINVQDAYPGDGVEWEFAFSLYELGYIHHTKQPDTTVVLEIHGDSMMALRMKEVKRLLANLAKREDIDDLDFVMRCLDMSGFEDVTPEEAPEHLRPR